MLPWLHSPALAFRAVGTQAAVQRAEKAANSGTCREFALANKCKVVNIGLNKDCWDLILLEKYRTKQSMKSWLPIPSLCHHPVYIAQVAMPHFRGKTALLITGICHLHLLAVVPQPMVCIT